MAQLKARLADLSSTPKGSRNAVLNTVAFIAGTLITEGLVQEHWAIEQLESACVANGYVADSSEHEARRIIDAGLSKGKLVEPERDNPVFDWAMSAQQLSKLPPVKWLIDGVIMDNSLGVVFGAPGCCKSFLALDMLGSVANRTRWDGHSIGANRLGLYVLGEGMSGLKDRVAAWESHYGTAMKNVTFIPRAIQVTSYDWSKLVEYAGETKPGLIVLDTLARLTAGLESENDATSMGRFVAACDALREASGGSVLVVHHANRAGGLRGSNALDGACDQIFHMERDFSGSVNASIVKMKENT